MRTITRFLLAVTPILAAGCINTDFACKGYPDNPICRPVSEVYSMGPAQRGDLPTDSGRAPDKSANSVRNSIGDPASAIDNPLVRQAQVMRVWLSPWRDERDRLHDAAYVYILLSPAEWVYTGPTAATKSFNGSTALPSPPPDQDDRNRSPAVNRTANANAPAAPTTAPSSTTRPSASSPSLPSGAATETTGNILFVPGANGMRPVPIPQISVEPLYP